MRVFCFPFILVLSFSSALLQATPTSFHKYYHQLKKILPKDKVSDKGEVCERIAELQLRTMFPDNEFEILPNVVYENKDHRVLGELDLVVINKNSQMAVLVVEVKCRRDIKKAIKTAKLQLARFKSFIESYLDHHEDELTGNPQTEVLEIEIEIFSGEDNISEKEIFHHDEITIIYTEGYLRKLEFEQFDSRTVYRTMSPKKGPLKNYDLIPLELSLEEVETLTIMLFQDEKKATNFIKKLYTEARKKIKKKKQSVKRKRRYK